ncbi:pseudouridine synthase family protein [Desulfovibrio sp.]
MNEVTVPEDMDGARLDQALELLLPGSYLRERRRVWETGAVLVDGRARAKGFRVNAGQRLALAAREPEEPSPAAAARLLSIQGDYAALFKPGGMHSAAIAGRDNPSVERLLPGLLPGRGARLLNRLDFLTSGIVLAGLTPEAAARYHELEDAGGVTKEYQALVRGCLEWPVTVMNALDTDDRKKTKVLAHEDESPLRWTRAEPLEYDEDHDRTLLKVVIRKGARHQIRAHLAHVLLPIVGDPLYGDGEGERLFLHHGRLSFEGFEAAVADGFPRAGGGGEGAP